MEESGYRARCTTISTLTGVYVTTTRTGKSSPAESWSDGRSSSQWLAWPDYGVFRLQSVRFLDEARPFSGGPETPVHESVSRCVEW